MIRKLLLWLAVLALGSPAFAATGEKPLFASSDPIRITIAGPMSTFGRNRAEEARAGSIAVAGTGVQLPVTLSPRGITRRATDVCDFPPLKVRFTSPPPATSIFAGQKSLKLVAFCRKAESFQQYVLLEYAAYRMFNLLSPESFRVRLTQIDFINDDGRPYITRYGFFVEDLGDVARRNGMREAKLPDLIPINSLSAHHAALYAMFQDMIANHDWSMRAGPKGEECCHNAKMIAPARGVAAGVVPIPYDFDFSGLINAPYATPPDQLHLSSVRQRQFRGYCMHEAETYAAAAQMRAAEPQMLAVLSSTPGLEPKTIQRATDYLGEFFEQIQSNDTVKAKVLKTCI